MTSRRRYPVALLVAVATVAAAAGAAPAQERPEQGRPGNSTLIVGIDVSGSFKGQYDDATEFASYYIYAHLHGLGGLRTPTALFVTSIGGERPGEPKAFHPIDDFANSSREQIASAFSANSGRIAASQRTDASGQKETCIQNVA